MNRLERGTALLARLDELATCSEDPATLTRPFLTASHRRAATAVRGWMQAAGMRAWVDAIGNVVGQYDAVRPDAPLLLLGSHIDTVRSAGKYDGNLGVIAAIDCVADLHRRGERLPFAIKIYAFGDEEGVRFPVTLSGSRAVAGTFDMASLEARDAAGVPLRQALVDFGCDPSAIPAIAGENRAAVAYMEMHIEQGPVLEAAGLALGVVTAINGGARHLIEIGGLAGHAGTVPMGLRRDALAGAAEMIAAVERHGLSLPDLVATVGRIEALPGAINVIPGLARFSIDVRAPDDAVWRPAAAQILAELQAIAKRRNLTWKEQCTHDAPACLCDPRLMDALGQALHRAGQEPRRLPSGAGHDAMMVVRLCPVGMLFVRCKAGISHNPLESITAEDAGLATEVFLDFIRHFDPAALAGSQRRAAS